MLLMNARIITMSGRTIERGYLDIDPPLIRFVGEGSPDPDWLANYHDQVIDLDGGWIVPGFIDAHCHIGMFTDGISVEGYDANESSNPVTPDMQAIDGLFHDDFCFREALSYGVTSVMTGPGSANVISGTFSLVHTHGRSADEMIIIRTAAMKAALGENPKRTHGRKDRSPVTRMANAAILRDALQKAAYYQRKKNQPFSGQTGESASHEPDARWEALLPVLSGEVILKIHAHRSDDILTAVRIAESFGLRYTLDHCTEGYRVAELLANLYEEGRKPGHGCGEPGKGRLEGIITGPLLSDRSKPELARSCIENPARLAATGIPVAIMTDHPVIPEQYLALSAAAAVRGGLPETDALAAITIKAAEICGVAQSRGTLDAGKIADFSVFSAHPFDYRCQTRMVYIDGKLVWNHTDEKQTERSSCCV